MRLTDARDLSELSGACFDVDGGFRMSAGEWADWLGDTADHPRDDGVVAVSEDGVLLAAAFCMIPNGVTSMRRVYRWIGVHPEARGRGVEAALLDWWIHRARHRIAGADDDIPAMLYASEYDWMVDRQRLLEEHGLRPLRWDREMAYDLSVPSPVMPPGIEVRPFRPDHAEGARDVYNEAFAGQVQPITEDAWGRYYVGGDAFRADLSFVATDRSVIVGIMLADVYPHDFEDKGRTEAWIGGLGTIPACRGKGVATALIVAALDAFRAAGYAFAVLGADSNNPTGAFGLYERLGFRSERSSTQYAIPVFAPFERQGVGAGPAERADETDPVELSRRGDARRSAGDLDGAAVDLRRAAELATDESLLLVTRLRQAILDHHRARVIEAEEGFTGVLEALAEGDDLLSFAWQHLGKLRVECGRFETARECFEKAARLRVGQPDLLASTLASQRALDHLVAEYRQAG